MREAELVAWDAIVDETRAFETPLVAASVSAWLVLLLEQQRVMIDPWRMNARPVVITESRSLAGVLRVTLREYGVAFCSTNAQTRGFLHNEVAPTLHAGANMLYLGDLDLAGERHIEATRGAFLNVQPAGCAGSV